MKICIQNAKIVLSDSIIEGALKIENSKIVDFGKDCKPDADSIIIDTKGKFLSPAFIDIHCHGTCGADFSSGKLEDFEIIAKQKLSEGVAKILPTSLCLPKEKLKDFMYAAKAYASENKYAKVEAVHLEGSFISKNMCGAQNKDFCRICDISEIDELKQIFKIAKVSYSLETDEKGDFAQELLSRNIIPSVAHSNANFADFERAYASGLRNITHFFNRCSPMTHRDLGIVGAGLYFEDVYLEIIPDLIHIDKKALELLLRIKDDSKIVAISDSILVANKPDGIYDMSGMLVEIKDGIARLRDSQNLAGSTIKMNEILKNLVCELKIPLCNAVKMLSKNPAESLNMQSTCIKKGNLASLCIFDEKFHVELCIVDGIIKEIK